jgi:hypothetical protein
LGSKVDYHWKQNLDHTEANNMNMFILKRSKFYSRGSRFFAAQKHNFWITLIYLVAFEADLYGDFGNSMYFLRKQASPFLE